MKFDKDEHYLMASKFMVPVYGDDDGGDPPTPPTPPTPPKGTKTFTQDELNAILAKERKTHEARLKTTISELEALRTKTSMSEKERQELDSKIEQLSNTLLTKEELTAKEKDKLTKAHAKEREELIAQARSWQERYTSETIHRALTDAASKNDAFSAIQIVALLKPNTSLVEVKDEDGKATGGFEPRVKYQGTSKDGKSITLDLTPEEAVKQMKEDEQYLNLFKDKGASGYGGNNSGKGKGLDIRELAKDPKAYAEARKAGKIDLGKV